MSHVHPAFSPKTHRVLSSRANASDTLNELPAHSQPTIFEQMPALARLRELRIRAGLTQLELADKARVARTTVVRLERGNPNAEPTTLRRLARALSTPQRKVTIDEMIGD